MAGGTGGGRCAPGGGRRAAGGGRRAAGGRRSHLAQHRLEVHLAPVHALAMAGEEEERGVDPRADTRDDAGGHEHAKKEVQVLGPRVLGVAGNIQEVAPADNEVNLTGAAMESGSGVRGEMRAGAHSCAVGNGRAVWARGGFGGDRDSCCSGWAQVLATPILKGRSDARTLFQEGSDARTFAARTPVSRRPAPALDRRLAQNALRMLAVTRCYSRWRSRPRPRQRTRRR